MKYDSVELFILKDRGYDISCIHYTGADRRYAVWDTGRLSNGTAAAPSIRDRRAISFSQSKTPSKEDHP